MDSQLSFYARQLGRIYLPVIGILLILIGGFVFFRPFHAYLYISFAFAGSIIFSGIYEVSFALRNRRFLGNWDFVVFGGVVDVALGIYFLAAPLITMLVLTPLLGIWVFYKGFLALRVAFFLRHYRYAFWWVWLVNGSVTGVIAVLMLVNVTVGILDVIAWTGLGIAWIGLSYVQLWQLRPYISLQKSRAVRHRY